MTFKKILETVVINQFVIDNLAGYSVKIQNKHILLLIIAIGAILRFWDYSSIPFTHDEFSAFFRTGFTDFSALMEKGVKTDTHPPGVQIFMNYWRLIFGDSPRIIKFPFTLMGIASIYLVWNLGRLWYNETVGLISASFTASLQFTIMYSQLARPYISGLFFTLLMVWYWSKLIKKPNQGFWINGLLFMLAGALSAYNHHFSLLFSAIIGMSGLFFISKELVWKYCLLGIGIFVLYIPNLSLFFSQLDQGGVGTWLAAPENDFLWQFIRYIFHYSWVLLSVATLILILSIISKNHHFSWKKFYLFTAWFLVPFLIGFFYSRYKNPVLQYSVLLFSFPYLFFILFGKLKQLKPLSNLIICTLIITSSIITLIINRQHYKVFYDSPYRAVILDQHSVFKEDQSILRILDTYPKMNHYYNAHLAIDTNYIWRQDFNSELDFKQYISAQSKFHDRLFFGAYSMTNNHNIPIIKEYYPTLEKVTNYEGGSSCIFSKIGTQNSNQNLLRETILKESMSKGNSLWMNPEMFSSEYSKSYTITLDSIDLAKNDFIDLKVNLKLSQTDGEVLLVSDMSKDGELLHWSATDTRKFMQSKDHVYTAFHTVPLSLLKTNLKGAVLKVYVFNKAKQHIELNNFSVEHRKGNPILYGLYEEIE